MVNTLSLQRQMLAVLGGGFCGTITRYGFGLLIQSALNNTWPYEILLVNITGTFVLALLITLADGTKLIGPTRRLFLTIGFLGAYTTFSSLTLGAIQLLANTVWWPALLYLTSSLLGGMLTVRLGSWLGFLIIGQVRAAEKDVIEQLSPQMQAETQPLQTSYRESAEK